MNLEERIPVRYCCKRCGIDKAVLEVPVRTYEQDVVEWMNGVTRALQRDHILRSPGCGAREFSQVWIPTTGRPQIGGPVVS